MGAATGGLIPLPVPPADMPTLHLYDRDAGTWPRDDEVGLMLDDTLDHRYLVQERRFIRELVTQDLPDPALGCPAGAELRLRRVATR
jgi:hypothetical protein